jgi:AbrB family looped-hinge helix DNA binding protein
MPTMRVTIDKAGRIVVPKTLRDELSLEGGTRLEIRLREGRLELEPVATPMRLVRRGKGLVATTDEAIPALSVDDVRAVIESQRR